MRLDSLGVTLRKFLGVIVNLGRVIIKMTYINYRGSGANITWARPKVTLSQAWVWAQRKGRVVASADLKVDGEEEGRRWRGLGHGEEEGRWRRGPGNIKRKSYR